VRDNANIVDNISQIRIFAKKPDRILGDQVLEWMPVMPGNTYSENCYSTGFSV